MKEALETQEVPEGMAPEMAEPVKKKRITVADLQETVKGLDSFLDEEITPAINQLEGRLNTLDKSVEILQGNQDTLLKTHVQMQGDLNVIAENISLMQDAIIALQGTPEPTELEFAKPPERPPTSPPTAGDIEMVAGVCLTMSDVLVICRALKEMSDLPDQEKIRILNIACRAAGVDDTQGLRIRAGITTRAA